MSRLILRKMSSGVGAALKSAKVEPGSTVVIFGLGAIGLAVCSSFWFFLLLLVVELVLACLYTYIRFYRLRREQGYLALQELLV